MDDDRGRARREQEEVRAEVREDAAPPTGAKETRRRRWPYIVGTLVVSPALLLAAWIAIVLHWHYSAGNRAGFIQKFSQKGWVCKTWEGELAMVNMPGASQEKFHFTVRNDDVASAIRRLMGSRVSLEYQEHRGVPGTCFGETAYYITSVKALR